MFGNELFQSLTYIHSLGVLVPLQIRRFTYVGTLLFGAFLMCLALFFMSQLPEHDSNLAGVLLVV